MTESIDVQFKQNLNERIGLLEGRVTSLEATRAWQYERIKSLEALIHSVAEHAAEASRQNGLRIVALEAELAKQRASIGA